MGEHVIPELDIEAAESKKFSRFFFNNYCKYVCIFIITTSLIISLTLYVAIPILFMNMIDFQRLVMFTNIGLPSEMEAYKPTEIGVRNIYITVMGDLPDTYISLGAWHILPHELAKETINNTNFNYDDALANSNYSVLIYFHGSGETRSGNVKTYLVLSNLFHIITFDYRDFGDSTAAMLSESAVANDSMQLYNWVRNKTKADIFIWGHSLGTALCADTISKLKNYQIVPSGVVLEAPFTSMREEIPEHPFGKVFSWIPWFAATILNPLENNGFYFNNSKHILDIECPILIIHAEDDYIIPYTLGRKLYEFGIIYRNESFGDLTYLQVPAKYECDHFSIYKFTNLLPFIAQFIEDCNDHKNYIN